MNKQPKNKIFRKKNKFTSSYQVLNPFSIYTQSHPQLDIIIQDDTFQQWIYNVTQCNTITKRNPSQNKSRIHNIIYIVILSLTCQRIEFHNVPL